MEQYISKSALVAEIEKIRKALNLNLRHDQGVCDGLYAIQKYINSLEVKELSIEDSIKEILAQKYINYTFRRHNIDPESREGQLIYYAYMHGINKCLDQLNNIGMEVV